MASIAALPSITNPRMRMPIKSKAQAGLLGAVAGGSKKLPGLAKSQARESLKGVEKKKLPTYAGMTVKKTKKLPNMLAQTTKKINKMLSSAYST